MQFELTILGSSGAIPAYDRHPTSHYIQHSGQGFLIDCGEGTQLQMAKYSIKRGRLDHIFISHLHGDHFFGLMGLLSAFNLNYRETPLYIYGPEGLEEIVTTHFKYSRTILKFTIHFFKTQDAKPEIIFNSPLLSVETIPLKHRIPTTGFLFREKEGMRRIIPEKIHEYQIPVAEIAAIKQGADFSDKKGTVVTNRELTLDPHKPSSYAFCSDTIYTEDFVAQIKGVEMLYHEATFKKEHTARAAETFHSTTIQAATIAQKAGVGHLIVGHYSARYDDLNLLLEECKSVFENSELAIEGKVYHF